MDNLASTYRNQGRWPEAEALLVQVVETRKTKLGPDHPDSLTSMNNLAFTWKSLGRDAEAIELMKECVRLRRYVLGTTHPHYTSALRVLSRWEMEAAGVSSLTLDI
ncbi:hypothetical protein DM02DRAFT_606711 [Periconia macrospinosa]|uniref:Kinesin light chain n=1 Tax=Periconia macrospinosa TaxID=97972 RepID=A0A2V1D187_9PLEO|nr:hypothetical protein DM02DRAFT_606711 [Periconia macrospinosa]